MQIEERCPWCGEVYGEKSKVSSGRRFIVSCEHCEHMAKEKIFSFRITIVIVIVVIVFAIMIARWRLPSWLLCIWGLLFSLIGSFVMMLLRMPRHRYCEVYEEAPLNELSLCEAKINWF